MIEVRLCERTCAPAASVRVNGLSSSQGDGFSVYFYYYYVHCKVYTKLFRHSKRLHFFPSSFISLCFSLLKEMEIRFEK
jgi:hypothetical protein